MPPDHLDRRGEALTRGEMTHALARDAEDRTDVHLEKETALDRLFHPESERHGSSIRDVDADRTISEVVEWNPGMAGPLNGEIMN